MAIRSELIRETDQCGALWREGCQACAERDVAESREAAPHHGISRRWIFGSGVARVPSRVMLLVKRASKTLLWVTRLRRPAPTTAAMPPATAPRTRAMLPPT